MSLKKSTVSSVSLSSPSTTSDINNKKRDRLDDDEYDEEDAELINLARGCPKKAKIVIDASSDDSESEDSDDDYDYDVDFGRDEPSYPTAYELSVDSSSFDSTAAFTGVYNPQKVGCCTIVIIPGDSNTEMRVYRVYHNDRNQARRLFKLLSQKIDECVTALVGYIAELVIDHGKNWYRIATSEWILEDYAESSINVKQEPSKFCAWYNKFAEKHKLGDKEVIGKWRFIGNCSTTFSRELTNAMSYSDPKGRKFDVRFAYLYTKSALKI